MMAACIIRASTCLHRSYHLHIHKSIYQNFTTLWLQAERRDITTKGVFVTSWSPGNTHSSFSFCWSVNELWPSLLVAAGLGRQYIATIYGNDIASTPPWKVVVGGRRVSDCERWPCGSWASLLLLLSLVSQRLSLTKRKNQPLERCAILLYKV